VVTGRRSGDVARLLTSGRRSPEGECAVVEQSCCDALSWELEPVNPRVGTGVAIGRRSGAIACLLASGRRSPESERAVVEQSCCDALSREPEPVNPRVGAGEPRVPFLDSDEVGSDIGRPR
jgi:hypothetical protein